MSFPFQPVRCSFQVKTAQSNHSPSSMELFDSGQPKFKKSHGHPTKKWALKCSYPSIYVKLTDLLSKKITKWCANRSQGFFFRPDAMSLTTRFLFWRRATSQQDVPLQSVDIIVSELFAHFLVGEVKAGWRESRGGVDLKVIPIANPPRRIGQPIIFPSQTPVYVKVVKVKVMLAPAWVGREQEWVTREQGSWHLWGCHECRWSSEYERNTSQVLKRALYYPTAHNLCADEVEKPCRKNRRTWHPDVTAILSLQGDEVEWLAEKFGGPEWGELFCCRAQAGKRQLGKLHHRTHGPRWFPTGFFSPINRLNWCWMYR